MSSFVKFSHLNKEVNFVPSSSFYPFIPSFIKRKKQRKKVTVLYLDFSKKKQNFGNL